MRVLREHLAAVAIVVVAVAATGTYFAVASAGYRRHVAQPPRDSGLPYTVVSYTAADARRAFAAEGIALTPRSRASTVTTLGNRGDVLEVDAFAARDRVERAGFSDYALAADGRYVRFPKDCRTAIPDAERWRGTVRVIVSCTAAGGAAARWLRRVDTALARL